jgi:hypothetical protein
MVNRVVNRVADFLISFKCKIIIFLIDVKGLRRMNTISKF